MISIILGCLWIVIANVLALIPSRDNHWARAYGLIAIGIPLLVYIGYTNGAYVAVAFLIGGASVLRWPVIYLARWSRRVIGRTSSRLGKGNEPE